MSLNGMAESRRLWCYRGVWLKCSKTVARQSQVLPVRACPQLQQGSQDNPASPSAIARILYRGPGKARLHDLCARPQPRARGTPGVQKDPRASTPRDIEACRSVCSCRKSAKPKASRARCFRLAPHPSRWSAPPREGETCCVTTPPSLGPGIRRHSCDGSTVRLAAVTAPGVRIGHARRGAAWTAGPRTASPMQGHAPGHCFPLRVWRR